LVALVGDFDVISLGVVCINIRISSMLLLDMMVCFPGAHEGFNRGVSVVPGIFRVLRDNTDTIKILNQCLLVDCHVLHSYA
jgi:hypothetical protein